MVLGLIALFNFGECLWAADLSGGHVFVNGETVTADTLNSVVGSATINTAFFTAKAAETVPADADVLLVYSPALGGFRQITFTNFLIGNQELLTALFYTADFTRRSNFLSQVDDFTQSNFLNTASVPARSNFVGGVSSGSWSNAFLGFWDYAPGPTGRVSATVDGTFTHYVPVFGGTNLAVANNTNESWRYKAWPNFFTSTNVVFTYGQHTTMPHGLPATPQQVRWVLTCVAAESVNGFNVGDEFAVDQVIDYRKNPSSGEFSSVAAFTAGANGTNVWVNCGTNIWSDTIPFYYVSGTNTVNNTVHITNANWRLKCYATYWP